MNTKEIRDKTITALLSVVPEADSEEIDAKTNFRSQLEIDSVDYLNFVLTLEKEFGIKIPATDYPKLSCLDGCLSYFRANLTGDQIK